jgi:uncharacterized protein (DUF924 family)
MIAPTPLASAADIVAFWTDAGPARWFAKDAAFDAEIVERFLPAHEAAARGALDGWRDDATGALALLILLDQFPRNMFRGAARAFATDDLARAIAYHAFDMDFADGFDLPLKRFFFLPMMHSEDPADQLFCVNMLSLENDLDGLKSGKEHRAIIERFGRFPHRNAILGRVSTPEEMAFLNDGGFAG